MKYLALLPLLFCLVFFSSCGAPKRARMVTAPVVKECEPIAWADKGEKPLRKRRLPPAARGLIVIDPGHGGEDQGTKSLLKPIYTEKNLNLKTARFLANFLEKEGFQTVFTRNDDTFIPLKDRATFANVRRPLLFVSVHFNAAASKDAKGIEVFYFKSDEEKERTKASRALAGFILVEVLESTNAESRGVKHGNYAVIRETNMPAVLVEGGFLTNSEDLEKLKDPAYLKQIARGIASGICKWAAIQ